MTLSKWFFAHWYEAVNSVVEPKVVPHRKDTAGKCTGEILELGAGGGLNLPYFDQNSPLTLVEPDKYMRAKLEKRISGLSNARILADSGESLSLPNNSFDSAVSTLVLCMVDDPEKVVSEIHRVLRPGGRYFFYEHVLGDSRAGRRFQHVLNPIWKCLTTGCNLDRDIMKVIALQGFRHVSGSKFPMRIGLFPPIPNIVGWCVK